MSTDARVSVRVNGGASGFYEFRLPVGSSGIVDIHRGQRTQPDFPDHYHTFQSRERGTAALAYLVEEHKHLKEFFEAVRKLSITRMDNDKFDGFVEYDMCDDEANGGLSMEDAWELVGTMIEEANAEKDRQ